MIYLLTFICGALYEITSAYWLFATEGLNPIKAALWSMLQALVMLTGIGESIKDVRVAVCFVIGYSAGSGMAVVIERRRRSFTLNRELCHGAASGAPNSNPPASAPLA